jgi:two-component system NarL family sensor kinase
MFPINLFATLAPNAVAATVMQQAPASDIGYYAVLVVVTCSAIVINLLFVTALVGLFYGEAVIPRLKRHSRLLAPLAVNIAVAITAVALYRAVGFWAIISVLTGVLIFAYVVRRLRIERESSTRIAELAASRGRLVGQLLEAEDRERRAMAQMLHDDVVQVLLVARQDLCEGPVTDNAARHPIELLDQAVEELRGTIRATHPSILERVGLATALTAIAELHATRAAFRVEVEADDIDFGPTTRLVFSAVKELLTNAAKHANATAVSVRVAVEEGWLVVRVADDGTGFSVDEAFAGVRHGHIGLASLMDRSEAVGGGLEVVSRPNTEGTVVTLRIPQRDADGIDHEPANRARTKQLAGVGQH